MRRRDVLSLLGGAAVAWPLGALAQPTDQIKRLGVITGIARDDPQLKIRTAAFLQELQRLNWTEGRNVRIDFRSCSSRADVRRYAFELAALAPDAVLAVGSISVDHLLKASRTVPIVFTAVMDPIGAGFVESLSRPGGNVTGIMMFEYGLAGKWLELLKLIAPSLKRAAVLRDPAVPQGIGQFAVIQSVAPSLGVDVTPISVRDAPEMERAIARFAKAPDGGLILTASLFSVVHRDLIISLADRHKLPAVYLERFFVAAGGLLSYGPNVVDQFRQAAAYVDRILKGEQPADLPVQAPTRYELVINLKTAKALGLDVPPTLLARAEEVIE
jgi:putative ABC transport system substrate-binding protein